MEDVTHKGRSIFSTVPERKAGFTFLENREAAVHE
jgi:hypothetical protein